MMQPRPIVEVHGWRPKCRTLEGDIGDGGIKRRSRGGRRRWRHRCRARRRVAKARPPGHLRKPARHAGLRIAIGRSSDYFGPGGVNSTLGEFLFDAAVKYKTTRWLGSLDVPHAVSYLEDMAVGLATLGERDEADGQIWHLPVNATVTGREFLTAVWQAVDEPARIGRVGRLTVRIGGLFSPPMRELNETYYQWERPFLVDDSKWQHAFGPYQPVPLAEAVARTLTWFISRRLAREAGSVSP
jgi:nucleoside-diphosphate-sugar epimerase